MRSPADIMGDCIAKKGSWLKQARCNGLAVTQPPKVLADRFLPICQVCYLLGHHAPASHVLPQPAGAKKKPQLSAWQCFWHIAHYGGRGSVSRGCAPSPNQTSTDIREGTKIYNADSTPVSPLSRISAQDCENFSTTHQRELKQW